jgi:hypothetical protein
VPFLNRCIVLLLKNSSFQFILMQSRLDEFPAAIVWTLFHREWLRSLYRAMYHLGWNLDSKHQSHQ